MVNILDKAIAAVSPIAGYRRATARAALSILNNGTGYGNYGASHTSRAMRSWHVGGGSSKEDIEDNLDTLRKRSRDAYMGIPLAAGALKTLRTNVVGSGLVPTPQVDADYLHLTEEQADQLQAQITREFNLWADSTACDASGMDNFWRMTGRSTKRRMRSGRYTRRLRPGIRPRCAWSGAASSGVPS